MKNCNTTEQKETHFSHDKKRKQKLGNKKLSFYKLTACRFYYIKNPASRICFLSAHKAGATKLF